MCKIFDLKCLWQFSQKLKFLSAKKAFLLDYKMLIRKFEEFEFVKNALTTQSKMILEYDQGLFNYSMTLHHP